MSAVTHKHEAARYMLGSCKCGRVHRETLNCSWSTSGSRVLDFRATDATGNRRNATRRSNGEIWLQIKCECGEFPVLASITARKTEQPCGAACRTAKGNSCECSCCGANHGADA